MDGEKESNIHPVAIGGFSRSAELYDKIRSEYPPQLAKRLFQHLGVQKNSRVLELAAGTGKWTERLLEVCDDVTVAEPLVSMREGLKKRFPRLNVSDSVAERLPFENGQFDFVFAATAFHWFDADAAYSEISRVLKPGGGLGLLWMARPPKFQWPEWFKAVRRLMEPLAGNTPTYYSMEWRKPFDSRLDFQILQFERHDVSREMTKEQFRDRVFSTSYIAALPELVSLALRREIDRTLNEFMPDQSKLMVPEELHLYWSFKE